MNRRRIAASTRSKSSCLFCRHCGPAFALFPIALGTRQFDSLEGLGFAIADVLAGIDEAVLVVASSDMNHYESDPVTRIKDDKAIERILALDARGLYDVVMEEEISMCGFGPTVAMLTAARQRARRAQIS